MPDSASVPQLAVPDRESSEVRTRAWAPDPPKYGVLNILVVEDDQPSRDGLAKAIRLLGHACRTARDGQEALEMHQQQHADVILSDCRMPRMDGLELCRRTRVGDDDSSSYTYFILMTGYNDKEHFLQGMEAGADDYHPKPIDIDELQARLLSAGRVISLYRKLAEHNSSLRRDSQMSFRLARVDPLTEVANRLRMNEDLEIIWGRAKRYGHRFSAALCDIDWFKTYNDHFGHLAGDAVLRRIAQSIRKELRQGDELYRYGGEEFLVVLPEQSQGEAIQAMERVRREVERLAIPTVAEKGIVTISIGVAELDAGDDAVANWLLRVDKTLYAAKGSGRNRVEAAGPP
jgi:two-component system cell cycle response regulator